MTDTRTTLVTPDGQRRAVILRRPDGYFQVAYEQWDDSAVSGIGGLSDPFWRPYRAEDVTETREDAEACARGELDLPSNG